MPAWAEDPAAVGGRLLDRLRDGDYAGAEALFTPQMAAAVPQDKLKAVWESLPAQLGPLRSRGEPAVNARGDVQVVVTRLEFERGAVNAQTVVDRQGRIAGFLLQPAPPPAAAAVPADAAFQELPMRIGEGERALGGTLALPKGKGPFPAVVLVHGSGPQDRDETIGPNRPFLDIARALAAQGIAVLRYDKRTQARPQDFAGLRTYTVDDEVTDDAVAALAVLRARADIDGDRVFVLGHSVGGMLAPRIARRAGGVSGVILLAAPARSLLTLLQEQNRYLLASDGAPSPQVQAFLDRLDAQIANVRGDLADDGIDTPMGLPAAYWRSLEAIDPVADARALDVPLLLLQGGRDFQVVDADWQRWRQQLGDQPRASFRHYPALNHLAIAGQGRGTPAEYQQPGHVDAQLLADLAGWIKEH